MRFPKLMTVCIVLNIAAIAIGAVNLVARKPGISEIGISTRIEQGEILLRIDGDDFGMDAACARSVADALRMSADELDAMLISPEPPNLIIWNQKMQIQIVQFRFGGETFSMFISAHAENVVIQKSGAVVAKIDIESHASGDVDPMRNAWETIVGNRGWTIDQFKTFRTVVDMLAASALTTIV
jgi:hypothetical protein